MTPVQTKGVFVNGRRVISQRASAELRTLDPCVLHNGKVYVFDNWAHSLDALGLHQVFINQDPILNQASTLKTCYGSETASRGIKSGTLGGPCHFKTSSADVFIKGEGIVRDGDLATANCDNTAAASIIHPGRYSGTDYEFSPCEAPEQIDTLHKLPVELRYTNGLALKSRGLIFRLKNSQRLLPVRLDEHGTGLLHLSRLDKEQDHLVVRGWEMIDRLTGWICIEQEINLSLVQTLELTFLPPPIIINAQQEGLHRHGPLTYAELALLKHQHCACVLYIPGGDVAYGRLAHHLDGPLSDANLNQGALAALQFSSYARSIVLDLEGHELRQRLPKWSHTFAEYLEECGPARDPNATHPLNRAVNGTGSLQARTFMEYNLNRASGFSHKDYETYKRMISFHWQADPTAPAGVAQSSTELFAGLLEQLSKQHMEIKIVTEGSGARLVLKSLMTHVPCRIDSLMMIHPEVDNSSFPSHALSHKLKAIGNVMACIDSENYHLREIYPYTLGLVSRDISAQARIYSRGHWADKWQTAFEGACMLAFQKHPHKSHLYSHIMRALMLNLDHDIFRLVELESNPSKMLAWQRRVQADVREHLRHLMSLTEINARVEQAIGLCRQTFTPYGERFRPWGLTRANPAIFKNIRSYERHSQVMHYDEFKIPSASTQRYFDSLYRLAAWC